MCVFYLDSTSSLDEKLWDLSTTTASDFTCEITITKDMWDEHLLTMNHITEPRPTYAVPSMLEMGGPAVALAQRIENDIVDRMHRLPFVLEKDEDIKIAHISFAYDNKKLLKLLIARGNLIT